MRKFEIGRKALACAGLLAGVAAVSGCTSIQERRGYIIDPLLYSAVQPGIDNERSVSATLGQPTFKSQYGTPTWYYVTSDTRQRPFSRPRIADETVMAITFDDAGNVAAIDQSGGERIVYLSPDSDETPTLGRERSFLEDLFGNIGAVGAAGAGAPPQ